MSENKEKNAVQDAAANDKLLKTRQVMLTGEISKESAEALIKNLLVLDSESQDPITLYINSPGGDADAGYAIFDMVRFISSPVNMVGIGLVASAAAIVLLASPKERRYGLSNSSYLIHQPLSEMKGVATDVLIYADVIEKLKAKINVLIAKETGKNVEDVASATERDYWLNAQEALSYGLISKVIVSKDEIK